MYLFYQTEANNLMWILFLGDVTM